MPDKDKHPEPYITLSNDVSMFGNVIDKKDGKPIKILESPFSNTDNIDKENME